MKLPNIRLSVCPFVGPVIWLQHAAMAGLLLWAGGHEMSIDCCTAGTQQQMQAVSHRHLTYLLGIELQSCSTFQLWFFIKSLKK